MPITGYVKQIFITRRILLCLLLACVPALLFYAIALAEMTANGFTLREILRDPAQQTGQSSFLGFVSNIGVWLWVSSAAICFFGAKAADYVSRENQKELLLLVGALSLILAIDDFFLLHERYVYQKGIFLFYMVYAITLLVRHFKKILEIDGFAFLLASLLLGLSVYTDIYQRKIPMLYIYVQVFEEGFKFVGAAVWLYFSSRIALFHLTSPDMRNQWR